MRGNIKKALVLFMVGLLVMQVLFSDASKKVFAEHSESGVIMHINGVRVVKEANTNVFSTCFCIAREIYCSDYDKVLSNMTLEENKAFLLNNAILLGFNVKGEAVNTISREQKAEYSKTQNVVWDIIEDKFSASSSELHKKVDFTQRAPSYVTGEENVLKWNSQTSKFELVLTNTNIEGNLSANTYVKVDKSTLPSGVTAQVNGETIKFTSTEEFTDVKSIKIYKQVSESGCLVAWSNGGGTRQPQISLDYGDPSLVKTFELKLKTDKKSVGQQSDSTSSQDPAINDPGNNNSAKNDPAVNDSEKTNQDKSYPTMEDSTKKNSVQEKAVKVETKNVVDEDELLDDVPKTGDDTNLVLAFKLIGASVFTMIALFVISLGQKRKNRL